MVRRKKSRKGKRAARPRAGMLRNKLPRVARRSVKRSAVVRKASKAKKSVKRAKVARKGARRLKKNAARRPARRAVRKAAPVRKARKSRKARRSVKNGVRRSLRGRKTARRGRRVAKRSVRSMLRNPGVAVLIQAGVGFASFLAGRLIAGQIARASVIPESVRPHAAVLGTGAAVALAYAIGAGKIKALKSLEQYKVPMLVGTSIALLDVLFSAYAPASVQALVALPASGLSGGWTGTPSYFPEAIGDQRAMLPGQSYTIQGPAMAEYIRTPMGEYIQSPLGEYVQTDEDGVPMGDLYNLDAGVIDDGLFGDPGDDALDIEVLD